MVVYHCLDDEDYLAKSEHGIGKRVILYFYHEQCAGSLRVKPIFEEFSKKYHESSIIYTFQHYGEDQLTSEAFQITITPTLLIMEEGHELHRLTGQSIKMEDIQQFFEKYAS